METYILKYDVHNEISFPCGTVVRVIEPEGEFEVVDGRHKGRKGRSGDGLNGWLLENTAVNMALVQAYRSKRDRLEGELKTLREEWNVVPTVKFCKEIDWAVKRSTEK